MADFTTALLQCIDYVPWMKRQSKTDEEGAQREMSLFELMQSVRDRNVRTEPELIDFLASVGLEDDRDSSAEELASELMVWLLRTVSDLAMALGTKLHMQPRHRYDTEFLNKLEQAVKFSDEIKENPQIRIAPCTFDMALEESDIAGLLKQHAKRIGYLYLSDSNGRLAGQGLLDWAQDHARNPEAE